jgi:hypothetical protein
MWAEPSKPAGCQLSLRCHDKTYLQAERRKGVFVIERNDVNRLVLASHRLYRCQYQLSDVNCLLTKNGVLCLPSGTSAILRQDAFAGKAFLS